MKMILIFVIINLLTACTTTFENSDRSRNWEQDQSVCRARSTVDVCQNYEATSQTVCRKVPFNPNFNTGESVVCDTTNTPAYTGCRQQSSYTGLVRCLNGMGWNEVKE